MAWVALDRAVRLSLKRSFPAPLERWLRVRDEIYTDIYRNFWNTDLRSFVQYKGAQTVDASTLLMPLVKFSGPTDPRWLSTLRAIENSLVEDSLVYRYNIGDAVRRYSSVNRRLRQKSYNYFVDFSELAIPQSRSWLCDAVIHLACAAR